ncbi:protein TAPETUM DETERMINANT 1-like [Trifolium pratense]|uniref:protein TAPETUM DETERMINANT 1-like n=1 Tax=Trifolium pratense TaxID=57577 RepID=UPI001E6939CA|nr:protein TAPETUM DETERMINANT 1-like [Trifolium pratense]
MVVLISTNGVASMNLHETSSISDKTVNVVGDKCSKLSIEISQNMTGLIGGIPEHSVVIANTCVSDCVISNIHVACGKFSSAILINPTTFKRLEYNDCLVNNGQPLSGGAVISFKYANTFPYELSVSNAMVVCK